MNHKIKFRVWNKHYKEYAKPSDGCSDYSFIQYKSGDFSLFGVSAECLVIQQYTGLKDKNSKEIYEGDIIDWEPSIRGLPAPSKTAIKFPCEYVLWDSINSRFSLSKTKSNDFQWYCIYGKIVGNIFEHPELVK